MNISLKKEQVNSLCEELTHQISHDNTIHIYTDGACAGNPGPGGWGVVLLYAKKYKYNWGYTLDTTNNRMEIQAVIEALNMLKRGDLQINLYTDSLYVKNGITTWINSWQKNSWRTKQNKEVKNIDLWQELYYLSLKYATIKWCWVKGHSDNCGNNIADLLAQCGKEQAVISIKNVTDK